MASGKPQVWCAPLVTSILPCAPFEGTAPAEEASFARANEMWDARTGTLRLSGAGNEVIAFQVAVERRAGALESVALEPAGAAQPELAFYANIAVPVEEAYHDDALAPVEPARAGELSKALARLLRVKGRKRQTYTVELYLPRGTPAGEHEIALVLRLSKAGEVRLRLRLTVFGFELPDEPGCTADLNAYGVAIGRGWEGLDPQSGRYVAIEREFFRMVHDHRAVFHLLPYAHSGRLEAGFAPVLEGWGRARRVADWTPFDERWGPYLDGSAFAGTRRGATPISYLYLPINLNWPAYFEKYGTPGYELEFKNVVREFAVHFAEKGWTKTKFEVFFNHKARWKYYPWDMDEIRFERDNKATLHLARLAREAVAGVQGPQFINRIDSSWIFYKSATSELGDAVNLWIVNRGFHAPFPDESDLLRSKGQEVWFYGGSGRITDPMRLSSLQWPWIAWGKPCDGFTWWNGIGWRSGPDVWRNPGTGSAHSLYPGAAFDIDGPLASLRLKVLRRGMQDHAYLEELTRRTGSRDAAGGVIREHLGCQSREDWWQRGEYPGMSGSEIRSRTHSKKPWSQAPRAAWSAAREALGRAIEKA